MLFATLIEKINTNHIHIRIFFSRVIFMSCYLPARPLFHSPLTTPFAPWGHKSFSLCLYFTIELFIFTAHSLLRFTTNVSHVPFIFSTFSPVANLELAGVADFIRLMGIVSS